MISAKEAIKKLEEGNRKYLTQNTGSGDISPAARLRTYENGQQPYAIVIACSDSRVIPESIFSAGIGELFTIRLAGNVIDDHQLGSIEYAVEHLGSNLVVVMGHTGCGAVEAAIHHEPSGFIKYITDEIQLAIGEETDPYRASCLNVEHDQPCAGYRSPAPWERPRGDRSHLSHRRRACGISRYVTTARSMICE